MSSALVPPFVCFFAVAVGYFLGRLELRRLELENDALRAGRQALANLEERIVDAKALEEEKRQLVRIAADQGERIRVLENALREVLPTLRKSAEEFRTGSGKPIGCAEWGAVAVVEAALGIESED
jgi:hypothetical protein